MKELSVTELNENFFSAIGKDWMLLTAKRPGGGFNPMTASWGGVGVFLGKEVCFLFVRPERYTAECMAECDTLTLSFFGGAQKEALALCGKQSGRDCNKIEAAGLTPVPLPSPDCITYEEATLALCVRQIYSCEMQREGFAPCVAPDADRFYSPKAGNLHRLYICEILSAHQR